MPFLQLIETARIASSLQLGVRTHHRGDRDSCLIILRKYARPRAQTLEPVGVMLMRPFGVMSFPPVAIVPMMMMFVPVAVFGPFGMMRLDPIRMMLVPPGV